MKTAWNKYLDGKLDTVMDFCEGYKDFLAHGKTERECTIGAVARAKAAGFKDINEVETLKAGDRVYAVNRGKGVCLLVIGTEDIEKGLNILGAHIDSPRIDIKQVPLYEDHGIVLLDTHYYGGIKKYQWVAHPMSLHGVVCKKDGSVVNVTIGEDPKDPVVGISDLLIHLSGDQLSKKAANVIEGEDLNVTFGSIPTKSEEDGDDLVKKQILALLKETYGIEEEDFMSAELELVPAGAPRDYGLDRSMIMGYGHDDRICAYTSLIATLESVNPERTSCCLLVDKEEVGSQGATGMQSRFFENTMAEVLEKMGCYSELTLRRLLRNSLMLSSDVSAGYDPNYPQVNELKNTAFLGKGIVFNKYTGSRGKGGCNDANPEFIAKIRNVLDNNDVMFQTAELGKVDQGGGGTIAYILANMDMEVIDAGIAVQNMHACYEVASKVDTYEAYRAYKVFLKEMR